MTGPGGAAKGNPEYEVMGVRRYWRYSEVRMAELIAQGRVVQPRVGGVPRFKRYLDESSGIPLQDIWTDINAVNSQAVEAQKFSTQKPESLVSRILAASSSPGDIVLDCFLGSGTTAAVAHKMGRRWIGIEFVSETVRKYAGPRLTDVVLGKDRARTVPASATCSAGRAAASGNSPCLPRCSRPIMALFSSARG